MKGNIGRQQVEANTTLPSAARLATIVRPEPDRFGLVSCVVMRAVFVATFLHDARRSIDLGVNSRVKRNVKKTPT